MSNSVEKRFSRYVQGGETDRYKERLGWWERRSFDFSDDDITFEITPEYEQRPDLIAHAVYGQAKLEWLVLQYNTILDITTELVRGKELRLPHPSRLSRNILTESTGGKVVS